MKNTLQTIQNFFLRVTELSKEASGAKIKVEKKKSELSGLVVKLPASLTTSAQPLKIRVLFSWLQEIKT